MHLYNIESDGRFIFIFIKRFSCQSIVLNVRQNTLSKHNSVTTAIHQRDAILHGTLEEALNKSEWFIAIYNGIYKLRSSQDTVFVHSIRIPEVKLKIGLRPQQLVKMHTNFTHKKCNFALQPVHTTSIHTHTHNQQFRNYF